MAFKPKIEKWKCSTGHGTILIEMEMKLLQLKRVSFLLIVSIKNETLSNRKVTFQ